VRSCRERYRGRWCRLATTVLCNRVAAGASNTSIRKWAWNFGLRTGLENTWTYHKGNDRLVRLRLLLALI
jgi:hypothetical protein